MTAIINHSPRAFLRALAKRVEQRLWLAVTETRDTLPVGARSTTQANWRDRYDYKRDEILRDVLLAWRDNPLARRIVGLTTQYVVGGGIAYTSKHEGTNKFLAEFWEDEQNRMTVRAMELCDELTRSGNLFILVSTDAGGMSYIRSVPASDIEKIDHAPNDVEQPVRFWPKATPEEFDPKPYPAYNRHADQPTESGQWPTVMLHYTINRPTGGQWGESDLTPILRWLSRFNGFVEDRARLAKFRQAFIWLVKGKWRDNASRAAREAEINANPPEPGSVVLADVSEDWTAPSPKLESADAERDGLMIKKMIAAGSANPLHFLAEPESSTRSTAESAGGPTYRHYEQRQIIFLWIVKHILEVVRRRRAQVDRRVSPKAEVSVRGADISARDNTALAVAASTIISAMQELRNRGLIDDAELLRMAYYFAGEVVDIEEMLKRGKVAPVAITKAPPIVEAAPDEPLSDLAESQKPAIDTETGEEKPIVTLQNVTRPAEPATAPTHHIYFQMPPMAEAAPIHITNQLPAQLAPIVEVHTSAAPAPITVQNTVQVTDIPVAPPAPIQVTVLPGITNVAAPEVKITNEVKLPTVTESAIVERDAQGRAVRIEKTYEQSP